ncbi:MAG: hypothetical protein ACI8PB_004661 [Desulforhopalus sp.]|jgi:hypothetical protein
MSKGQNNMNANSLIKEIIALAATARDENMPGQMEATE